jgi:hypothetical protein
MSDNDHALPHLRRMPPAGSAQLGVVSRPVFISVGLLFITVIAADDPVA